MVRITKVEYLHDYTLRIEFTDGFERVYNLENLLSKGIALSLRDINQFIQFKVTRMGALQWANGFDICADFLRYSADEYAAIVAANTFIYKAA
jgi:Protein of unknown function (DUF2442)